MGFENGKLVRVVVKVTSPDDAMVNVFHYDLQDEPLDTPNDPQLLADAFRDDVVPKVKVLFTSGWTVQPVEVVEEKDPLNPTAPRSAWVSGTPQVGTKTIATDVLPRAMCAVATLYTDHIGRRFRGRTFLPGRQGEADFGSGVWVPGQITLWQAYLDAIPRQPDIVGGVSASKADWCVYSRTQRAQDLDPYASHVNAVTLRNTIHWLRSREGT